MPKIVNGTFFRYNPRIRHGTGTSVYEYSYDNIVGWKSGDIVQYKMYCPPNAGEAFDEESIAGCQSLRITITYKQAMASQDDDFAIRFYDEPLAHGSGDAKTLYYAISNEWSSYEMVEPAGITQVQTYVFETDDTALCRKILTNGFALDGGFDEITVQDIGLDVYVIYAQAPPIAGFDRSVMTNGYFREDGTYVHMPDKPFVVGLTYFQEAGAEMFFMHVQLIPDGTAEGSYNTGTTSLDPYTISVFDWGYVPQTGRIGIRASSIYNIKSDIVYLNYEIAHRDVRFLSHTNGDIVASDNDLPLEWEAVLPERFADIPEDLVPIPYRYTVRYWFDTDALSTTVRVTDASAVIPAGALSGGSVLHVKVEEAYWVPEEGAVDRISDIATLNLYVRQAASADNVSIRAGATVGTEPITVPALVWIEWRTSGQTAYQVRVGNHISPVLFGSASSYVVPEVLPDGIVDASVRIQDAYGKWGDWTAPVYAMVDNGMFRKIANWGEDEVAHTVTAVPDDTGAVAITVHTDALVGSWDLLIYRDNVLIAVAANAAQDIVYTDRAACGVCEYRVIAVHTSRSYYMGPYSAVVEVYPASDTLILDGGEALVFPYVSERPEGYSVSTSREAHLVHYAGRTDPVLIDSGRRTRTLPLVYVDTTPDLGRRLEALDGKAVWFKNVLGMRMRGAVGGLSVVYGYRRCVMSFTLTQLDHNEAVPYVWRD